MLAAVFSDTHSATTRMLAAVRETRPDLVIHLGDHDRDAEALRREFPDLPLYSVCGNCDMASLAPYADIADIGGVKAFLCHGHLYGVKYGDLSRLAYAAQERGCRLALFGHTHRAELREWGGVTLLNPGTAGSGRRLSWATIEVFPNGGFACQIHYFE